MLMSDLSSTNKVFDLRKEGRLDEALQMARGLFQHNPNDVWNVRALGWVLISLIWENKDSESLQDYINELTDLN